MNEIFLLGNGDSGKKTKEQSDLEWQEFMKEQVAEFDKLLIEKGIKKQETIKIGNT